MDIIDIPPKIGTAKLNEPEACHDILINVIN